MNNMGKMQYVAGILGLNILDQFQVVGSNSLYMITDNDIVVKEDDDSWVSVPNVLYKLLTGKSKIKKPLWKPNIGDRYYVPNLERHDIIKGNWDDTSFDSYRYNNGLVFRTEEEAQNMLNEILSFVKKERGIDF